MKNTIIVLILMLSITFLSANAQDNSQSYIGITSGISSFSGNYTKNNYDNPKSGFANPTALHFAVEGAYYFHKNWGIAGMVSYTDHGTIKGTGEKLGAGYVNDFGVDNATVVITESNKLTTFMVGPCYSILKNKFMFDTRVLVGVGHATTPNISVSLEDGDPFIQKASSANGFACQAGVGVRYQIVHHLQLLARVDYFYTQPDFKIENENRVNNTGRIIRSYNQPITGMIATIGVAYTFK